MPAYRWLWAARTVSQWGDVANTVALGLLVFELTGSGLGVAGVAAAEIVPVLAFAPLAGVIADRLPRRRLMIAADLGRALLAAALTFVGSHVMFVYLIAFGMSVGAVLFNPAAGATLPGLVGRDRLVAANSGIWITAVVSQVLLAPATGGLVSIAGLNVAFWANAASFLASAALLTRLPRLPAPEPARTRWWRDVAGGVGYIAGDATLRRLALGQLLAALSAGGTSALLVVYIRTGLDAPPAAYGIVLGAIGVGATLGPLVLMRTVRDPTRTPWVFGPYALRAVVDLALAGTGSVPVAAVVLAAYGVGTSTGAVTFNSLLQATVPDTHRGRVFAAFDLIWQSGRLASLLIGGVVADATGIRVVYLLGGVLLLAAAATGLIGISRGRAHR